MRVERIEPGRRAPDALVGAVLTRDLRVGGERWSKGRRLSARDLDALAGEPPADGLTIAVLVADPGDVHEDDAARRLADLVGGEGLTTRGPAESRIDLVAETAGVLHVRVGVLERLNEIDAVEVFTAFDGTIVAAGQVVASVKVGPHLVPSGVLDAAAREVEAGGGPTIGVAGFIPRRIAVLVKEAVRGLARDRFETNVRAKVESLGSTVVAIDYLPDESGAVREAVAAHTGGPNAVDLILTAGGRSTDPSDPFFVSVEELGGEIVSHGVPAHPGSMLWLARVGDAAVLGLPTCGAYSKATAADLILPRLLTGEPPTRRLVAGLGHGGLLTRDQRFRFPRYARELDAPEG
ncbi:MAG TPA: molybdopterin-binding protein [Candidatus Limnocylindrales bacterium]|nr:molybdopterin-binding protein [Candidatus Limnocylindrales bacterium]